MELLVNIATKDQATVKITDSLMNAKMRGQKQVEQFVKERLVLNERAPKLEFQI